MGDWREEWETTGYERSLGEVGDQLRVRIRAEKGRVFRYTVQWEAWIENRRYPVMRYDTAHGYPHRDTLDWEGRVVEKRWGDPDADLGQTLDDAIAEVEAELVRIPGSVHAEDTVSTATLPAIEPDTQEHADKRNDLHRRFLHAGIADPAIFAAIPRDVLLMLLPDDDPAFVERELVVGAAAVRRGQNVYFHHVRVADLPEPPPRSGRRAPGSRRTFFNWDGSIHAQEVVGGDGEWHPVEPVDP